MLARAANEIADQMSAQVAQYTDVVRSRREDFAQAETQQRQQEEAHHQIERERNAKVVHIMF